MESAFSLGVASAHKKTARVKDGTEGKDRELVNEIIRLAFKILPIEVKEFSGCEFGGGLVFCLL